MKKVIGNIFYAAFITMLIGIVGLLLASMLPIPGDLEVKIVESGSMEPAIKTGAVVVTYPAADYQVGDVITFKSSSSRIPTTHRIAGVHEENGRTWYTTKGDANEEADNEETSKSDVIGRVLFDVPYAGYILDFSRKPLGFAFLVGLPALLIVLDEISKIWGEVRKMRRRTVERTAYTLRITRTRGGTPITPRAATLPAALHGTVPVRRAPRTVPHTAPRRMMDIGRPAVVGRMEEEEEHIVPRTPRAFDIIPPRPSHIIAASLASVIVGSLILAGMGTVGSTLSYPVDRETSEDNTLTASAVDFRAVVTSENNEEVITMVTPEEGSADVRYDVRVEMTGGSDPFCAAISALVNDPFAYGAGPLLDLTASDVVFTDPWTLHVTLPDGYGPGTSCSVEVVYTAWRSDSEGTGYFDEERVPLTFSIPVLEQADTLLLPLKLDTGTSTPQDDGTSTPPAPELIQEFTPEPPQKDAGSNDATSTEDTQEEDTGDDTSGTDTETDLQTEPQTDTGEATTSDEGGTQTAYYNRVLIV